MGIRPSLADDASPEAYGEAMMLCQGYAPACSDAGECANEGYCFSQDGLGLAAAKKKIAVLISAESDIFARCWLKVAADALEDRQFVSQKTFDAMRYIEIKKRVRKLYGQGDGRE